MTATQMLTETASQTSVARCRFCGSGLHVTFIDLGMSPLCESFPSAAEVNRGEMYYPLHVYVCNQCFLVQLEEFEKVENIFSDYAYFSSYSESWLKHADHYCAQMQSRFNLDKNSFVVEVASNDGYLLQYFVQRNVPVLGIEPAANVASVAESKGVPTLVRFFGEEVARDLVEQGRSADLIAGNNVFAQVPDLNDFVEGLKVLLKPEGVITLEFPHLSRLIEHTEFDTIYHEHFSYFSLITTVKIMKAHGLKAFDVEELQSHGGSLRVYSCRNDAKTHPVTESVDRILKGELAEGLGEIEGYTGFAQRARETKFALLELLLKLARDGKQVAGYGAPGKSATLLHYCGIGKDLISYTVDRNPYKHGRFLPGTHIPIFHPDRIRESKPDFVVILPWNLQREIVEQLQYIREWGGRFIVPIPTATIID
jgi:2-polyprenyl-3-methyl-5-hydroxy-6-metoxy-1,4-benzoquinol methylase